MKRTTNYDLPTWEKDDFIRMQDFNDLTGKLDAALKSGADAQTALQNAIKAVKATAENAYSSANKPYVAGSYTGNGGTQTVDLGFKPRFLVISRGFDKGDYSADYALFAGTPEQIDSWMAKVVSITDTGFTVKMATYNTSTCPQLWLNTSGKTYSYLALR
jgi:hypothetical protein